MNEQIEAIRAEIKRLEEIHERNLKKPMERGRIGFAHGVVECCDRILSFIDSLPEESENHGCGVEFPHFGANYPDAKCIDGYLWDMDSYEDGIYTIGGDDPCPICNTEKWLKDVLDDEIFKTRDEALEYVKMLKSKYKHKDSLPEEPDNEAPNRPKLSDRTLEDEMINYWGRIPDDKDLIDTARHFALWQKEQIMDAWLKDRDGCFFDGVNEGKKAMREQMLKEIEDAKDFEKVLADVFQSATTLVSSPSELVDAFKGKLLRSAFKCFAEKKALRQSLFAKQFSELPDEIKAVIERIAHDSCYTFCESFASLVAADKSYRKGKHDMKEQMMKEAVEGYVNYYEDCGGILMAEAQVGYPYHNGENVRIIIVKEDKK